MRDEEKKIGGEAPGGGAGGSELPRLSAGDLHLLIGGLLGEKEARKIFRRAGFGGGSGRIAESLDFHKISLLLAREAETDPELYAQIVRGIRGAFRLFFGAHPSFDPIQEARRLRPRDVVADAAPVFWALVNDLSPEGRLALAALRQKLFPPERKRPARKEERGADGAGRAGRPDKAAAGAAPEAPGLRQERDGLARRLDKAEAKQEELRARLRVVPEIRLISETDLNARVYESGKRKRSVFLDFRDSAPPEAP